MQIICRIKKALGIASPAPYEYCSLGLNAENKKKCKKCEHFKISQYYAYEVAENLKNGLLAGVEKIKSATQAVNDFCEAVKELNRKG